ncbi:hypothetical protein SFRURICE_009093 [Spodoptera frugiperda]|uniref:Parathymosin n=1 Tax=Spodoptera frugiperda TaxID=7108 RepID=A0A2H1VIJ4_SPOFR|nr:parathymosin [Spodoptera frugiperda]KAF9802411.1 hypothetical protein SFRURICE_009093 [Spodoptera frugiperda]
MTKKLPQIQLTVNKHGQLVQTIAKPIHDGNLPITLEEFQVQANAALTQMIEDLDELGQMLGNGNMQNLEAENSADEVDEEEDESDDSTEGYDSEEGEESDNEDSTEQSGPKKKKHY